MTRRDSSWSHDFSSASSSSEGLEKRTEHCCEKVRANAALHCEKFAVEVVRLVCSDVGMPKDDTCCEAVKQPTIRDIAQMVLRLLLIIVACTLDSVMLQWS